MPEVSFMRLMDVQAKSTFLPPVDEKAPKTYASVKDSYNSRRERLGFTRRREMSTTNVPGVEYQYRASAHKRREYMVIKPSSKFDIDMGRIMIAEESSSYIERWKQIAIEICNKHKITIKDLRKKSNQRKYSVPRHEACYRLYNETILSTTQIAVHLGYRDHSSVTHGIKKHEQYLKGLNA
jgi:hypothetical protein